MNEEQIQKIHKKLVDNPMFESFNNYLKKYGSVGYLKVTEEQSVYLGSIRYGKSRVYFNVYVDKKGAISDMIFDLRNVYEVYKGQNVKTGEMVFINDVDIHERLHEFSNDHYFCGEYDSGFKDDKPYFALGISLVGYRNDKFNKYTPWAGAIYEVLEALDKAYGFEGKDKKNKIKREDVDKTANSFPIPYYAITALFYIVGIIGLALIVSAIAKRINGAVGWIFGIICIIVFLWFGLICTFTPITHKKEYFNNSGDLEKHFFEAEKSIFIK